MVISDTFPVHSRGPPFIAFCLWLPALMSHWTEFANRGDIRCCVAGRDCSDSDPLPELHLQSLHHSYISCSLPENMSTNM